MGKSMIIEAQDSSLVYEKGQKGVLGKLSGVFANFRTGTRNGGRLYNEELVDKRIFGNEDVMEALETRTLFGELDHPEGDRCETLAQNAAVSIIKLEKDADEGVVKGEALILDTPSGRTLKALVDSGAHMGISSRGIGEEIISNGQTIIDPDTYDFITFDVVVTPANKGARLSLVEGKQRDTRLYKSIEKEIDNCISVNQLDQIKKVVESSIPVGKARLCKLIESKITALTSDEDITDEQSEDIDGNEDIIPQEAEVKTEAIKVQEGKLICLESKTSKRELGTKLSEQKLINKELQSSTTKLMNENKDLLAKVEKLEESNTKLQSRLTESRIAERKLVRSTTKLEESNSDTLAKLRKINERKIKNLNEAHSKEVETLNEAKANLETLLKESNEKYARLLEANRELTEKLIESKNVLDENVTLNKQIKQLNEQIKQLKETNQKKLQESKTARSSEIENLQIKLEKAESEINRLTEAKQRISKLPFNVTSANLKYENMNPSQLLSSDDEALFNTMVNMNRK